MPDINGVHHLALTVSDVDRSEQWYAEVLGFTRLMQLDEGDHHRITLVMHPAAQVMIGLHAHGANDGGAFSETRNGLDHLSFGVADRKALEEWVARFDELGVKHSGITDAPYGGVLVFRDPDNIQLELFCMPG